MREIGLGVVVVAFNSGGEAVDCVESVLSAAEAAGVSVRIAVVDNASPDDVVERLRGWASGATPYAPPADLPFTLRPVAKPVAMAEGGPGLAPEEAGAAPVALLRNPVNSGFAGGVNVGLAHLARFPDIRHFWVLNPDAAAPAEALAALAARLETGEEYGLMGGRVVYLTDPDVINIDGGTVNRFTGVTGNLNLGRSHRATPPPDAAAMAFITGASMVASRRFLEAVGPMREDYFLYYEEVDWAFRRGALPLAYCEGFAIFHRGGSSIGSHTLERLASPLSLYFLHRGRMRFLRRFGCGRLFGMLYTIAYAARFVIRDRAFRHAGATLRGGFGLPPGAAIRARFSKEAAALAFAPMERG